MNIAIEGCCHGELDQIYYQIEKYEQLFKVKIDALLICGDFQALRNNNDLDHMHCPEKYKKLGNFYEYYCGNKDPYVPTIIIGGNHQAVNHSRELYFGGYVAKNIYFLGQTGSVWLRKGSFKLRVTGISGIFNFKDFFNNHLEPFPFENHSDRISSYHYKQSEIFKLDLLAKNSKQQFDIFMSHDWPSNITKFGDQKDLLVKKPFFREDIEKGQLGCPALKYLEGKMKSSYWFSAHLHVKFPAVHKHDQKRETHFLALDKCLKNRDYLQFVEFQSKEEVDQKAQVTLEYDLDWLTVLKLSQAVLLKGNKLYQIKNKEVVLQDSNLLQELSQQFQKARGQIESKCENDLIIPPSQFKETVLSGPGNYKVPDLVKLNNQTERILSLIGSDKEMYDGILYYNNEKQKNSKAVYRQKVGKQEMEGWGHQEPPKKGNKQEIELDL